MGKPGVTPLKIARQRAGYFQYQIAAKLGLSSSVYCNAENKRGRLSDKDVIRAARILKVPVEELTVDEGAS
jgi:transcriptional regulator with XRE-family HTH domain